MIDAPEGWIWRLRWKVNTKYPFIVQHGDKGCGGGQLPHKNAALYNACSTVLGHFHAVAGVEHFETVGGLKVWGACAGSLIDDDAYAFNYNKGAKLKPVLSVAVVLNDGKDCHIVRM